MSIMLIEFKAGVGWRVETFQVTAISLILFLPIYYAQKIKIKIKKQNEN